VLPIHKLPNSASAAQPTITSAGTAPVAEMATVARSGAVPLI
jgi:hypothetical protein